MSSRAAAILLSLLALACARSGPVIPLLGDFRVKIGSPPVLLLGQIEPVPYGNAARSDRLLGLFREVGCDRLEKRWRHASGLAHAVCTLHGESQSTILVSANFDQPRSHRFADNWLGAAMLPSLYRSIRVVPRQHTYAFVGFADEGRGRPGSPTASARMVGRLPDEERESIVALVILKGLQLDVPAVWRTQADPNLHLDLYSVSRSLELPMRHIDFSLRHRDPWRLSERLRLPRLDVPSILIGLAGIQVGEYLDSFRLVAAYLSYLDQTLELRKQLREERDSAERPASG